MNKQINLRSVASALLATTCTGAVVMFNLINMTLKGFNHER